MFFNRQKIFDFVNETLQIESIQGWDEQFSNQTTINGTTTTITDTMNSGILPGPTSNLSDFVYQNGSDTIDDPHFMPDEPLFVLILVSVFYMVIFVAGILGNLITCLVIHRNKSMHTGN